MSRIADMLKTSVAPTVLHLGRMTIQDTPEKIAAYKGRLAALFDKDRADG